MYLLRNRLKFKYFIYIYLLVYFILNILFLVDFPFVHSDEPWLSGLSRAMMESRSLAVTEPFFDSFERNPHSIKLIFHFIQILFIKIFDYNIFTFRLISLFFSIGTLYVFYNLAGKIFASERLALFSTIILSLDIHYIYSSHLARQEIIILFFIVLATYLLFHSLDRHDYFKDIFIGLLIGLSIGIHPNSFILAIGIGGMYLFLIISKKISLNNLLLLILIVAMLALIFISISFQMDRNFLENYRESGKQFGVEKSFSEKVLKIGNFYKNLYNSKSVTYYIPNIKFQLIIFPMFFILSLLLSIRDGDKGGFMQCLGIGVIFINLGIILIGRYNVTSIIFIFPFCHLLVIYSLINILNNKKSYLMGLLFIILFNSWINIKTYSYSYKEYLSEISKHINRYNKVLAPLNSEYYFDNGKLLDFRNLHHNKAKGLDFKEYIISRGIEYIIYPEEMDYIYEKTPIYNGVYGDISIFYEEMKKFLEEDCDLIYGFVNSTYGTNIVRIIDQRNWKIYIYIVKYNSN